MEDITTIKQRLNDKVYAVCERLLPKGVKEGHEWRCGDTSGSPGKSLGVHLTGEKRGVWSDFNSGEGGDLLDLWCACQGISLAEAVKEAERWLGLDIGRPMREPKRTYRRPQKPKCSRPQNLVHAYLTVDRSLSREAIQAYRLGEDGDRIIFPFLNSDGELIMVKSREAKAGAAPKPIAKDMEPILFGWQAIPSDAREVVLTEGEIDACAMWDMGWPALSVPFGGGGKGKQNWIENEYDNLQRFERIYLALDMDGPGNEAVEEIAARLGRHRCQRVELPYKDADECLLNGVTKADMDVLIANSLSLDPEGLKRAAAFTDEVIKLFWPVPGTHLGYYPPYDVLDENVRFRPGEMTIWTGPSGDGKSQILSDCVVDFIHQGSRVCLSSLEMKGAETLKRMVKQSTNTDRATEEYIVRSLQWLDKGLLLYQKVGKGDADELMAIFDYARAKYGCDQFVIDSLMRMGIASDDYVAQEQEVFKLVDWAVKHDVHLHLVAHARKAEKGRGAPATEDVKGASEIASNASNIVSIWRNRPHEEALARAERAGDEAELKELRQKPPTLMRIAKQRNGDFEGQIGLFFDQKSYRYSKKFGGAWKRTYPIWPESNDDDSSRSDANSADDDEPIAF